MAISEFDSPPATSPRTSGSGDPVAERAVRSLVDGLPTAAADVAAGLGARPATSDGLLVRAGGGCSSPLGGTPYGFSDACARHDLRHDLLRSAARRGDPLLGWARRALDDQFAAALAARCAAVRGGPPCTILARLYAAAVRLNTARQGGGPPLAEDPGRWAGAVLGGTTAGLLAGARGLGRGVVSRFHAARTRARRFRAGPRRGRDRGTAR